MGVTRGESRGHGRRGGGGCVTVEAASITAVTASKGVTAVTGVTAGHGGHGGRERGTTRDLQRPSESIAVEREAGRGSATFLTQRHASSPGYGRREKPHNLTIPSKASISSPHGSKQARTRGTGEFQ